MLSLEGLHVKRAVQCGIWVPTQYLLLDQEKSLNIVLPSRPKTSSVVQWSVFLATERRCIVFPVRHELNLIYYVEESRPPLRSSGQSSWLQNGDVLRFL
jgi:hypothetical protein